MLSKKQRKQNLDLAENVGLLSHLTKAPAAPRDNLRPSSAAINDPRRILSFETEVCLASTLAFICSISDDPCHVIAVCVEELPATRAIRVVVAINKERPQSQNEVLKRIKDGLAVILGHLSRVGKAEDTRAEERVFAAVADMCQHRILGRIRSKRRRAKSNKRAKQKAWLGSLIQRAIQAIGGQGSRRLPKTDMNTFKKRTQALLETLELLEKCDEKDVLQHIQTVIRAAHRLHSTGCVADILATIQTGDLNTESTTSISTRVEKLARYWECSAYLVQLASSLGIFQQAEVVSVSLDPQLFVRDTQVPPDCLQRCIDRCRSHTAKTFPRIQEIEEKLNITKSSFMSIVQRLLRESKVHAEVQIVCHYELHPPPIKPRVICSSKDACYLCNLLIQIHGEYHVPRTHSNLYPGWRVLPVPALNRVYAQLNRALEARIRDALPTFMDPSRRRSIISQNPNESALFPNLPPVATTASTVVAEGSGSRDAESRGSERQRQEALEEEPAASPAPSRTAERRGSQTGNSPVREGDRISAPGPACPVPSRPLQSQRATPESLEIPRNRTPQQCGGPKGIRSSVEFQAECRASTRIDFGIAYQVGLV
ncbi:hypothetical protein VTJ49DRAFT_3252 [Mycothermus thermophilus]|uniref:Uncharacterized protein n=1 Tax=Humicola insolens TaxID=85995 RepID=A0ABR3V8P2_HUMIN